LGFSAVGAGADADDGPAAADVSTMCMGKAAIMGALNLYLDFINLFIMLLRLLGERR
jgi:hypothetical protein